VATTLITDCKAHPERVIVGHPINPPHLIPLVEVVPHPGTFAEVSEHCLAFYRSLGKKPILVRKEVPGFVVNRLQVAVAREAYSLCLRGVATAEEIDLCMTESLGPRWAFSGPFMTLVLGGGGGRGGFAHLLHHLMPGARSWAVDMEKHAYDMDQARVPDLDASVQKMLDNERFGDTEAFQRERDRLLIELLKVKDGWSSGSSGLRQN